MAFDDHDLQQRVACAAPDDTVRGMIFNGVGKAVRGLRGPDVEQALWLQLGKPKWVDFFSYPVADYLQLAWAAVPHLLPVTGTPAQTFFQLGFHAADSFLSSAVGKMVLTLAARDTSRMVNQLPNAYAMCVGYGTRAVVWKNKQEAVVTFRRDFLVPPFHEGR